MFGCVSIWFPNVKSGFANVQVSFPCFLAVGGHIIVSRIDESEISIFIVFIGLHAQ